MAKPELSQAQAALSTEFPLQVVQPTAQSPYPQLGVVLDPDQRGRERILYVLLQPPTDEVYTMQLFCLLPFQVAAKSAPNLARLIAHTNLKLPLIGFGMGEADGWVYFRTIVPLPPDRELDSRVVLESTWLAYYMLDRFGPVLEEVATGALGLDEAMRIATQITNAPQPSH